MVIQLDGEKLKLRAITHICKAKKRDRCLPCSVSDMVTKCLLYYCQTVQTQWAPETRTYKIIVENETKQEYLGSPQRKSEGEILFWYIEVTQCQRYVFVVYVTQVSCFWAILCLFNLLFYLFGYFMMSSDVIPAWTEILCTKGYEVKRGRNKGGKGGVVECWRSSGVEITAAQMFP